MPATATRPNPPPEAEAARRIIDVTAAPLKSDQTAQPQALVPKDEGLRTQVYRKTKTAALTARVLIDRYSWRAWATTYMALNVYVFAQASFQMLDQLFLPDTNVYGSKNTYGKLLYNFIQSNKTISDVIYNWQIPAVLLSVMLLSSLIYFRNRKWVVYLIGEMAITGVMLGLLAFYTMMLWAFTGSMSTLFGTEVFALLFLPISIAPIVIKLDIVRLWKLWADGKVAMYGEPQPRATIAAHTHWTVPQNRWFSAITED